MKIIILILSITLLLYSQQLHKKTVCSEIILKESKNPEIYEYFKNQIKNSKCENKNIAIIYNLKYEEKSELKKSILKNSYEEKPCLVYFDIEKIKKFKKDKNCISIKFKDLDIKFAKKR